MGLGSDSQPVSVSLGGLNTYLADSQQFVLEYASRLQDDLPGAYYVGTSCCGEDPDSTHLNQFCHVECGLLGGLDDGIAVANRYVVHMTEVLERTCRGNFAVRRLDGIHDELCIVRTRTHFPASPLRMC